mgnify:CR=1 FL=1
MSAPERADVELCSATHSDRGTAAGQVVSIDRQVRNRNGPNQPDSLLPNSARYRRLFPAETEATIDVRTAGPAVIESILNLLDANAAE